MNDFLRRFQISKVSKFVNELRGILQFGKHGKGPLREDLVVYRGIKHFSESLPPHP
jgi:hypothetical protein